MRSLLVSNKLSMLAVVAATLAGTYAQAATLTVLGGDKDQTDIATKARCVGVSTGGRYQQCTSTAKVSATKLTSANDAFFQKAFDAWNKDQQIKWALVKADKFEGEELKGVLDVSVFDAVAMTKSGGLNIQVKWEAPRSYKKQFYWSQAVLANHNRTDQFVDPYYFMDVRVPGGKCQDLAPPLYPCNNLARKFKDKPRGPWPGASFQGHAYISQIDDTNPNKPKLIIYEGVNYGYKLSAIPIPETSTIPIPASLPMIASGFAALVCLRRGKRQDA